MTFGPGQMGAGRPPLEGHASAALAAVRGRMSTGRPQFPPPRQLSAEEEAQVLQTVAEGGSCPCCGGVHFAADFGCPRLSSFRRDADGMLVEGTYWPDSQWDKSKIMFADPDARAEGTDGAHPA